MRWRLAVCVALVVLAAACASPQRVATPSAAASQSPLVDVSDLSGLSCTAIGEPATSGPVTFVAAGRLFAVAADGSHPQCLAANIGPGALSWGPQGDRVLVGSLESILASGQRVEEASGGVISPVVSAPTGRSVVFISSATRQLLKTASARGGAPTDVSFLQRHDEVAYHPAGTHVAVVGEGPGRPYGIWLATNVGRDPRQLAVAESARRVFSLSFSGSGELAFAADHGDHFDVHWMRRSGRVGTVYTSPTALGRVVASRFNDLVAFRDGACTGQTTTRTWKSEEGTVHKIRLAGLSTEPAGWLPDGSLLLLARATGCTGPADLYVRSVRAVRLVARGVDRAAVRAIFPAPPPPPVPGEAEA